MMKAVTAWLTLALAFLFEGCVCTFNRKAQKNGMCLEVVLTGTGVPAPFNGVAGSGTLVSYGTVESGCRGVNLLFDIGRATTKNQLSKIGLEPTLPPGRTRENQVTAIFLTHLHSDHVEDLGIYLQARWNALGDDIDIICSQDIQVPIPNSGGATRTLSELPGLRPEGPSALGNVVTFAPTTLGTKTQVWSNDDGTIVVYAATSNHIGGHASYRVDTPAGSVVIGGDATNDNPNPQTRSTSTSFQVEMLARGANILVHSTIHPALAPGGGSGFPPLIYNRQSNAPDLGAMAKRARVSRLVLTHLAPPLGADVLGIFPVPGGALTQRDYKQSVREGGFQGRITVGTDLKAVRIYQNPFNKKKALLNGRFPSRPITKFP